MFFGVTHNSFHFFSEQRRPELTFQLFSFSNSKSLYVSPWVTYFVFAVSPDLIGGGGGGGALNTYLFNPSRSNMTFGNICSET